MVSAHIAMHLYEYCIKLVGILFQSNNHNDKFQVRVPEVKYLGTIIYIGREYSLIEQSLYDVDSSLQHGIELWYMLTYSKRTFN